MSWELFIDDERFPEYVGVHDPIIVARNSFDAIRFVETWGFPIHIYFDHDLSGPDKAMVFVRWLENYLIDEELKLPSTFTYSIHSMNPVGAENIRGAMTQILEHYKEKK